MKTFKIGADVSKLTLDYYNLELDTYETIKNTSCDIRMYLSKYEPEAYSLVVEPTGTYHIRLCEIATDLGFEVLMANPVQSSYYMKVLQMNDKTDENAAKSLSLLGSSVELPRYKAGQLNKKQLRMVYNALKKQEQSLKNQLESLMPYLKPCRIAIESLKRVLHNVQIEIKLLEDQLHELSDDGEKQFYKLATSVVGIGKKSAHGLLQYTNGFQDFDNSSQLVKYIGIVPSKHYSGTSIRKKGRISKNGPSTLRACLYNAAKSAKRYNHACKALYERLRINGKPHKVAMVAIIRKLLRQVFAVVKNETSFDNELFEKQIIQNKLQVK